MYQVLLVSTDGEGYQLDCKQSKTVKRAWERCDDLGSKWYFCPICFVVKDHYCSNSIMRQRIIDAPDAFDHLKNRTVSTAMDFIKDNPDFIKAVLS